ncbi:MAG TPA: hypothetical protein VG713_04265 [Pirellulales bacterium]|nr:hypothetical protein [Pirellulales bacterium]
MYRLPVQWRAGLAVGIITACALGNARLGYRALVRPRPDALDCQHCKQRLSAVMSHLPVAGPVGYMLCGNVPDRDPCASDDRYHWFRYLMVPRQLQRSTVGEYLLVDIATPADEPDAATLADWRLVADGRNGLKLYRRAETR